MDEDFRLFLDVVREERLDFSLCPPAPAGAAWFRLTRAGS